MKGSYLAIFLFATVHLRGQDHPVNTLAKLKDYEQLTIDYRMSGCYYQTNAKLTVTRIGQKLQAEVYSPVYSFPPEVQFCYLSGNDYLLLRTKMLTPSDIGKFIVFENQLRKFANSFISSTTTHRYLVKSNYFNASITDGGGQWDGFTSLLTAWFGPFANSPF